MDEEEPDISSTMSLDEDLVNETVTYNEDCDSKMSEEYPTIPSQQAGRTRTLSATYTFPDPEEPSRNLVLEFPISPPQIHTPVNAGGNLSQLAISDLNQPAEESADAVTVTRTVDNQTGVETTTDSSVSIEQPTSVSDSPSLNQPSVSRMEPTSFSPSPWMAYMHQRIQQVGYPTHRSHLDRQKSLFRALMEDHHYGQKDNHHGQKEPFDGEGKPTSSVIRSKKTLFFADTGLCTVAGGDSTVESEQDDQTEIDVDTDDVVVPPMEEIVHPYNRAKAFAAMSEMERFMDQMRGSVETAEAAVGKDGKMDEDPLVKTYTRRGTWTSRQRSFFDSCIKILQSERHVRLAASGNMDEPIIRRLSLDKASARFRRLMASVEWSGRLVYWLHATMVEGLNSQMLAMYFEILQTLKPKIPELVNSLVNYLLPQATIPGANVEGLLTLLDHPWDPIGKSVYRFDKTIKLPKNPIIVIAPHPYGGAVGQENSSHSRIQSILKFFTRLGTVVQVDGGSSDTFTPSDLYKNMLITTRDTLIDLRKIHMERPLVLVGLGIGAMVACQASLLEQCAAIVCFGFPLKTPRGIHGDYGDPLLKMDAAVQFILGLDAGNCPHAEFHDFWDKLTCDTEVVWAAGCDDYLRMNSSAKMSLKMTQSMVDRCFLETMVQFLQQALLKDRPRRAEPVAPEASKKRKGKPTSSATRTPTKRSKNETLSLDDKNSKKIDTLTLSESTTSSQEMSNGNSQSSSDTLPAELVIPPELPASVQEPSTITPSLAILSSDVVPSQLSSDEDPPPLMTEQATLSLHYTTTQSLSVDPRRRQEQLDAQKRMYDNSNRMVWNPATNPATDAKGGVRMGVARGSVIAHTNTGSRLPSLSLPELQQEPTSTAEGESSSTSRTIFPGLPR